uniref:Uncharacterized protein n=1 Tax=Lepeophtheirus salmonis TaxID=72036 RepID=A0A0K2V202_LEPSM
MMSIRAWFHILRIAFLSWIIGSNIDLTGQCHGDENGKDDGEDGKESHDCSNGIHR